jgi:hypothetical protein
VLLVPPAAQASQGAPASVPNLDVPSRNGIVRVGDGRSQSGIGAAALERWWIGR